LTDTHKTAKINFELSKAVDIFHTSYYVRGPMVFEVMKLIFAVLYIRTVSAYAFFLFDRIWSLRDLDL